MFHSMDAYSAATKAEQNAFADAVAYDRDVDRLSGNDLRDKYGEWLTGPRRSKILKANGHAGVVARSYTVYGDGQPRKGSVAAQIPRRSGGRTAAKGARDAVAPAADGRRLVPDREAIALLRANEAKAAQRSAERNPRLALRQRACDQYPTPPLRTEVVTRDGNACVWCGSRKGLHVDHVWPLRRGGPAIAANLQTLCESCNLWKRDRQVVLRWSEGEDSHGRSRVLYAVRQHDDGRMWGVPLERAGSVTRYADVDAEAVRLAKQERCTCGGARSCRHWLLARIRLSG